MITLSITSSDPQCDELLRAKWATAEDHAVAQKKSNEKLQQKFLLARAIVRALLFHVTGDTNWRIIPDAKGKPYVCKDNGQSGPNISLSHTEGLTACALSWENPLGIDVEYWRPRDFKALADFAFSARECNEIATEGMSAFYRIWTLKEAVSKLTGKGIFAILHNKECFAGNSVHGYQTKENWQLFYMQPKTNYSLAVATVGENGWAENAITWVDPANI